MLTLPAARALQLAAQGLLRPRRRKAVRPDVLAAIRNMGVLQIDTIHVVARSPYFVLWSRLGDYQPAWLDELLVEGCLFEYWAHEACFIPIEDYGLYRHRMIDPQAMGWKYSHDWMTRHQQEIARLLEHIRASGPVRSADFERQGGKGNGWWDWKPEKRSLEVLFTAGELMVARRQNFQRIYDLRERVLPAWQDARDLRPANDCLRTLWLKAVRALGVTKAGWIGDYFRTGKADPAALAALVDEGLLVSVGVEGWKEPGYVHRDHLDLLQQAQAGQLKPTLTALLSPFDPLVWDRKRALAMFGFDYRIECYTPAAKRHYGYFVLPILHRGALVGRLDAKAHRKDGVFEVKALHLEPAVRATRRLADELAAALLRCAQWHGTPRVVMSHAPADLKTMMSARLASVIAADARSWAC